MVRTSVKLQELQENFSVADDGNKVLIGILAVWAILIPKVMNVESIKKILVGGV